MNSLFSIHNKIYPALDDQLQGNFSRKAFPYKIMVLAVAAISLSFPALSQIKEGEVSTKKDSLSAHSPTASKKEEENRNVMLNAESNAGPRFIQIGIPTGSAIDVPTILENDLPAVYHFFPRNPNTFWRAGSALSKIGVLKLGEVAITTGRVGYGVNSYSRKGSETFSGIVNYGLNHFSMQRFDANLSGKLSKGLYYSANVYQMFDPGSFKLPYADFQDRTSIYSGMITKEFNNKKGELSVMYKHANAYSLSNIANYAPFIYKGDGSIEQFEDIALGTKNISPLDGRIDYKDVATGANTSTTLKDAAQNEINQVMALFNYKLKRGLNLKVNASYSHSDAGLVLGIPTGIIPASTIATSPYTYTYAGTNTRYTGNVLTRLTLLDRATINDAFLVAELSKKYNKHSWRLGINEMYSHVDHQASSVQYSQELAINPSRLDRDGTGFYSHNTNGEYYKGSESKTAIYFTDDWNISKKLDLYYGARMELTVLDVDYLPYARTNGFYKNGINPATGNIYEVVNYKTSRINPIGTVSAVYKLTKRFGLTGEFIYNVQNPTLVNYAGAQVPVTKNSQVPLGRVGVYYNSNKFSLVSAFSMIKKTNYFSRFNLSNPSGNGQVETVGTAYDVETFGWTTDLVARPFKKFSLHLLFTYQEPTYKNFAVSAFGETYSFSNNIVTGQSKVLAEIDPSYQITKDLKIWTSFRYFGKQTANLSNALYFNGRWESFGGVNWALNPKINIGVNIVNFLNQTGARGNISGAELITDAGKYNNYLMAGQYIRPFTGELSVGIKF